MTRRSLSLILSFAVVAALLAATPAAVATPVCTDGYMGGPPRSDCGGRVFPESGDTTEYVQYSPDLLSGFAEYQHGVEYLAQLYPRWVSVFTLSDHYADDDAVSAGPDQNR